MMMLGVFLLCSLVHFKSFSFLKHILVSLIQGPGDTPPLARVTVSPLLWPQPPNDLLSGLLAPPDLVDWLLPPGEDSAGAWPHQTGGHVIGKIPCVRWLLTHTQTFVPDFAARWKMRKCDGHRQKCWIQTKIFIKDQHLLNIICQASSRLVLF